MTAFSTLITPCYIGVVNLKYADYNIYSGSPIKNDFLSKGRSVSDLKVHWVLTTKYRRKLFNAQMLNRLHEILKELLGKWDCKLVEFNGEADHVHVLFQYHPDLALSNLVNNLKSVTREQA